MAWLGRESLNKEIKSMLDGFNINTTNKQVNRLSELVETHFKRNIFIESDDLVICDELTVLKAQNKELYKIIYDLNKGLNND